MFDFLHPKKRRLKKMRQKRKKIQGALVLVGVSVASILSIVLVGAYFSNIEAFVLKAGVLAPLVSIALYGILSVTPIPSDPLSLINGALFGPIFGGLVSWMGNNVAALIEYYIGHGIESVTDFEEKKSQLPLGLGKFPADSPLFLILGRFVPHIGGKVVSVAGGLYQVPLWRYTWTAAVANLFGSMMWALGGFELVRLF